MPIIFETNFKDANVVIKNFFKTNHQLLVKIQHVL